MSVSIRSAIRLAAGAFALAALLAPAGAQTPEEFYKGRQMTMLAFSPAGSTYDNYARALARHMGNFIPGKPTFVVQNMVGAGGLKLVDYLYRIAPKDGSVLGTIGRGLAFEPMLGRNEVNFDPYKLTWIGSMNREATLAMAWHTGKVKTFADLQKTELIVPGTGAGSDSEIIPLAINRLAGTKFRIINGYVDTSAAALAMERGEIEGLAYWSWTALMLAHPDWLRDGKVNLLFHTGSGVLRGSPATPAVRDLVKDPDARKALELLLARETIGRPFIAPPGVPPERARVLREAFAATLRDPVFRADAERAHVETELVSGAEVDALFAEVAATPKTVVDLLKSALDRK